MSKIVTVLFLFFMSFTSVTAQELNCSITINSDNVSSSNKQVFSTLERALQEFVNNNQWTSKVYGQKERIDCGMTLILNSQDNTVFSGSLQVNAVRPVFGSSYSSPIFNYKDANISFEYVEFEPLVYNPSTYESNLISLITYYIYMIIAIDSDTFEMKGGEPFYKQALDIANLAQQGSSSGWEPKRNSLNRYSLVDLILSPAHKEYREIMYGYHRNGMDLFSTDKKKAKDEVLNQLMSFQALNTRSQNSFLFRIFFDAKSDEVVEVFKSGPEVELRDLKRLLGRISAPNSAKWKKIK
tara:strand:+ start:33343 stop:34233 length:891 start_codon:yes stop_codon:yes gene_type:complete